MEAGAGCRATPRAPGPTVHDRARALQPGSERRAQRAHGVLLFVAGVADPPARGRRARRGERGGRGRGAHRDPPDAPALRRHDRQHHAERALLRPQRGARDPARRRASPAAHRGDRRAVHRGRLGDPRVVQHQLPGASAGRRRGVRGGLQRGPDGHGSGDGRRGELAGPLRQASLGRDPHRALPAVRRRPQRHAPRAGARAARALRRGLARRVGHRAVPGGRSTLPRAAHDRRARGFHGRAASGGDPEARRAAVAQQHRVPVESSLLRRDRRRTAPAHRVPHSTGRSDRGGRGGQRGVLVRPRAGGARGVRRRPRADRLLRRQGQLPRRRPPRPRGRVPLARRRDPERPTR